MRQEPEEIITRGVRKDNTIIYGSNRYTVPVGTYAPRKRVAVETTDGLLKIVDLETGELLVSHRMASGKGELVRNNNHRRDYTKQVAQLYDQTLAALGGTDEAADFLDHLRKERPRYVRDQFQLILTTANRSSRKSLGQALCYCMQKEIWSAVEFRTATEYFAGLAGDQSPATILGRVSVPGSCLIKTQIRSIGEYVALYGGAKC
jgi:hypothetical protein